MSSLASSKLTKLYKWIIIILLCSLLIGSASAGFLWSLDFVTKLYSSYSWLLLCLPVFGVLIAFMYAKKGPKLGNGNRYIMTSFLQDQEKEGDPVTKKPIIPFLLTPLVFIATLCTHLGGGSAGREGTAVQMGASIASQLNSWFSLDKTEQKLLTCIGISAGFAGVFGTPIAAGIFAFEFFGFKKIKWFFIIPSMVAAFLANFVCTKWGIQHAKYTILPFNNYNFNTLSWIALSGILFGLTALLFIRSGDLFSNIFSKIKSSILRPLVGGLIFTVFILLAGQEKMTGLGLPMIEDAFLHQQGSFDFIIKLLLTTLILNAGFKGGEVTPLFFIGAVLGSALAFYIPLPISLLAGLGLVAVFAGATHCVITAILLGMEMFGIEFGFYILIACAIAYLVSGASTIYKDRPLGIIKKAISPYFL